MASTVSACPNCKANVTAASARFCQYCGTALPQPERPAPLSGQERTRARFEALREHPRLPRLMRRSPSAAGVTAGYGAQAVFGVIFTVVAVVIFGGVVRVQSAFDGSGMGGPPTLVMLFPMLFVGIGIAVVVSGSRRAHQMATTPTRRTAARVADERVEVSGGGKNSSASTTYYVTLEDERGRRSEYRATAEVAAKVAPDDIGIAYLKAFLLLDFERVRV